MALGKAEPILDPAAMIPRPSALFLVNHFEIKITLVNEPTKIKQGPKPR